jgi:hypothetical protein
MDGPDLKPRVNRYAWILSVGSRSRGSDLTQPRSNPGHWLRIGRLERFGRGVAALGPRSPASRGGASPETAQLGAPGVVWDKIKPRR